MSLGNFNYGEDLNLDRVAELIRNARSPGSTGLGVVGPDNSYTNYNHFNKTKPIDCYNKNNQTLPRYSVFSLEQNEDNKNDSKDRLPRIASATEPARLIYYTNSDQEVAPETWFEAYQIDDDPFIVEYDASYGTPKVGHPIGPVGIEGKFASTFCGFVVIKKPDTDNKWVMCQKCVDYTLWAEVTVEIPEFGTAGGGVKLLQEDGSDAIDPETRTAPWVIIPKNTSDSTIAVGEKILLVPVMGLGYVPITGGGGSDIWVGQLEALLGDCAVGDMTVYEQEDDACPPTAVDPKQTIKVLNITGQNLEPGAFMKATKAKNFNHPIIEPIQLEPCAEPSSQVPVSP